MRANVQVSPLAPPAVDLIIDMAEDLPCVMGDEQRLGQVRIPMPMARCNANRVALWKPWHLSLGRACHLLLTRLPTTRSHQQVLINLVGNALKFTREGSVTLSAKRTVGGIEVSLKDTGSGIPESSLAEIFEPFNQVIFQPEEQPWPPP